MQDTGTESIQSNHSHISKVLEWGFDKDHNFTVAKWGCVLCDITADKPFKSEDDVWVDHTSCDDDCFGCKVKNLQLNAGDARGDVVASGTTQKKWDSELDFYRQARKDGIQPEGTTRAAVERAYEASEVLNKAYNGEKMPKAGAITKQTAEVMKEVGAI